MIYMLGSNMWKAFVVFAAGAYACGGHGQCSGHHAPAPAAHDLADGDMVMEDDDMKHQNDAAAATPPSDEEFETIKASLKLSNEDVEKIESYVAKIPDELKDDRFNNTDIARMFVRHYDTASEPKEGDFAPKSRQDLLDEIKYLVEVEIPTMMGKPPIGSSLDEELDALDEPEAAKDLDVLDEEFAKEPVMQSSADFRLPTTPANLMSKAQSPVKNEL